MSAPSTPLVAIRARRLGDFSDQALLWLALPPTWTLALAAWCEFPAGKLPLPTLFANAVRTGLALSDAPTPQSPDLSGYDPALLADLGLASSASAAAVTYWAAPGTRSDILTRTLADRAVGQAGLRKTAGLIGERIRRCPEPAAVPPATRRWAELAALLAKQPGDAAAALDRQLEALLIPGKGDAKGDAKGDTNEALRWIEAAAPLAELFGGEMLAAVQRAGARLELFHRRDFDRRHLGRFLERAEQMQAFADLLDSPPDEWALHFIGLGGVGKTMLVRHLTLLLTDDERFQGRAACARVDFDHLSPEYPTAAPGLLLERLSTELALYGQTSASSRAFERFRDRVKTLHEGMPPPALGAPLPLPTDDPKFLDVLAVFIEALRTLPQPVVLILDTCEELARISAGGDVPLNVRATFAILEQMQALAQRAGVQARVIFCGRRPLASAGAGWQWPTAQPLPPRPYLRLHAIRGFTHDEARTFLTARASVPAEPADRIAAIIERSPEYGRLEGLIFTDPTRAPADVPRCSPFDLDLIAAWVREAPGLDAQTIRSADADQYIDLRIMGRLQPRALRDLMPAVALLGRFDLPMLAAAAGDPDSAQIARPAAPLITLNAFTFRLRESMTSQAAAPPPQTEVAAPETEVAAPETEVAAPRPTPGDAVRSRWQDLFDALARQEWMDRQDPFLEVDRLLLPKLRAYFLRRDEEALDLACHRGAAYLRALTLAAPTDTLGATHLDNALRLLLSDNPAAAPAWWAQIEERFANPRDWPWLERVCDRILARDGAVGAFRPNGWQRGQPLPADAQAEWEEDRRRLAAEGRLDGSDTPLRAAVLATYNAALLHLRRPRDLHERWQEALAILTADAPPTAEDDPAPRRLLTLRAAAGCLATAPADLPAEQRAAWLQRLTGLIRPDQPTDPQAIAALLAAAETGQAPLADLLAAAGASSPALPAELSAWAALLTARELAGRGQMTAALAAARQALELTRLPVPMGPHFTWLDWLPPADLNARVRLEFSHLVCPALLSPADALAEIGAQPPSPGTLDADRLGAKLLELHAASAAPKPDAYAALALPVAAAIQEATPPLFAALAVARAEIGAVDEAAEALRQAQTAAESAVNLAGQRAILAARLAIVRQFRLRDVGLGADIGSGLVSQTVYPQIQPQLWATAGLAAPGAQPVAILADVAHAWWRSRPMHSADDLQAALALLPTWTPDPDALASPTFDEASRLFDEQERIFLAQQWPLSAPRRSAWAPRCDAAAWEKAHPHEPAQALILHLRSLALTAGAPANLDALAARVGIRRAAQVAWDEGELLALRLPERAIGILRQAAAWAAWAKGADDAVLGFRVQITLALAAARAGQQKTLEQALQGAKALFQRLPFVNSKLLNWDDLAAAAQDGDIVRVGGLANKAPRWPLGWQPWLVRAVAAQAALLALQKRPSGLKEILAWAASSFGVTADDKTVKLPPELEALRALLGAEPGKPEPVQPPNTNNLLVLGLLIVIALLGGLYWLYNQGLNWVTQTLGAPSDQPIGTPARIGLFVVLLFGVGLAAQIPTWLRRQFRARSRPQLTVRPAGLTAAAAAPTWRSLPPVEMTYSRLTWRWVWRWPFIMAQRTQLAQAAGPAAVFSAYGGGAEPLLPTALQQRLREDQAVLRRQVYDMTVDVEPGLAQFGWEGLVVAALKEVKRPQDAPLRLRRVLPGAQPASQDEQPLPVVVASLAGGFEQQEMAQQAWEASQKAGISSMVGSLEEGIERPPEPAPTVLHLQAAPTRTTAGVRLKISAAESLMTQTKFYQAERGRTLAVEDLPPRFERLRLVILQAPAMGETKARSEADYEEAALLRELAATLFLKGVPCIVTIPPLPAEVAPAALASLTAALIRLQQAGGLDAAGLSESMQTAVRQARQDVAAAFGQNAAAGFEAAWDLCLYAAGP